MKPRLLVFLASDTPVHVKKYEDISTTDEISRRVLKLEMRPLTEPEKRTVFSKLANYAGPSLKDLFAPTDASKPDHHVFRLSGSRVYYVRLSLANLATSVPRDKLLSCGTCMGR